MMKQIVVIAAMSENRCIGVNNTIPWKLAQELGHFRKTTSGFAVIMGRKTWESLPEKFRPLPHRKNVVISSNPDFTPVGATPASTLEHALQILEKDAVVFIIGGASVYAQAMKHANSLIITRVHHHVDGDAFFPEFADEWRLSYSSAKQTQVTEIGNIDYTYETYVPNKKG